MVGWFMPRTLRSWLELSLVLVDLEDIYYIGIRATSFDFFIGKDGRQCFPRR